MVLVRHTAHLSFDFFIFSHLTPCELDCTKDFVLDHRPTIVFLVESVLKFIFPCTHFSFLFPFFIFIFILFLFFIFLFFYFFNNVVAAASRMLGFSFSYSLAYL